MLGKQYKVISPNGEIISVEEYMKTDDYNDKLEQQINDFITNKKEKELIELIKKRSNEKNNSRSN
jgi:hypothetical protein